MARTIWLHIGLEKTGTKSVQDFCAAHRAELAETGLIYPQLGFHPTAHFALVGAVLAEGDDQHRLEFGTFGSFDEEWGALATVLDQHPHDDVLLSAEHFSSRVRASGIARIARWFDDRDVLPAVRVVVNLRRQDEFLLSTYGMAIRHGRSMPFDEYWPSHLDGDWRRYDFDATLSDWAREFGDDQLVVGVHERSAMPEGVVAAFFDLLGRPLPPGGDAAVHL
ncbi:MAG: hypothetical protein M3Z03_14950, partial [Actinomycetota bacterium]|nr:hypothetical protein [Actinomycetota bacterium]